MKSKLLETKKYPAACEYCKNGRLSPDEQMVLCIKKGLVAPDDKCRRYSYDPLKRRPKKPLLLPKADPSDFELSVDPLDIVPPAMHEADTMRDETENKEPDINESDLDEDFDELVNPEESDVPEPIHESNTDFEHVSFEDL